MQKLSQVILGRKQLLIAKIESWKSNSIQESKIIITNDKFENGKITIYTEYKCVY